MPRLARIDAPGALHHVIVRGIEQRTIFKDDTDRRDFLGRLAESLKETDTPCFAWALMPNHFHLLLETGQKPVGRVMQSVLTGYALAFNRRHKRTGHLFQNRFKSILCEREPYLLELVRYIHLNPLRAGLVSGLSGLDRHPWSGHSALMGHREAGFQAVDEVLLRFGKRAGIARAKYRTFIEDGIARGSRPDLVGGELIRSLGGWDAVMEARRSREHHAHDERILGSSDFVVGTLKAAEEREKKRTRLRRQGWDVERIILEAAKAAGIQPRELSGNRKTVTLCLARALACKWLVEDLGVPAAAVARRLGISHTTAQDCAKRGRALEPARGLALSLA